MRTVTQHRFGGPEVLEVVEAERPEPGPGEVLIRVHAVGLNPVDAVIRSGAFPLLGEPPFQLGWDLSGVVEAAGPGARFAVGDEVYGMPRFPYAGPGYSEYAVSASRQVARKPATIDHAHAAALPLAGLTAWQALVQMADVQPGQRVLVSRAAGGVGHLAVQIAKHLGAEVVALASEGKHEFVRSLGADRVIDYRKVDFAEVLKDLDVVLDGSAEGERAARVLRPGGTLLTISQHWDTELLARIEATGRRAVGISVEPDYASLEALAGLVDAGRLRPHVSTNLPLEEIVKAHEVLDAGNSVGKIVLSTV